MSRQANPHDTLWPRE